MRDARPAPDTDIRKASEAMSAADSVKQTPAAADHKLYEPSMEEILASIRRIIADDHAMPGAASPNGEEERLRAILAAPEAASPEPVSPPAPTVRAIFAPHPVAPEPLRAPAMPASMPAAAPGPVISAPPVRQATVAPEQSIAAPQYAMPDAPPPPEAPAAAAPAPAMDAPMAPAEARTTGATEALAAPHHPLVREDGEASSALFSSGTGQSVAAAFNTLAATRLIENDAALKDMARDMIRPMLKDWLDDNLPVLVERLVRAEIERVGRSGR